MEKRKIYILIGTLLLFLIGGILILPKGSNADNRLFINEIMSSNGDTIMDEDGDYSDWIELYNGGKEKINLQGYFLSDNPDKRNKWIFPKVTIEPGEHLLIWASGKDKIGHTGEIHTNFSISSAGEPIILTEPGGRTIVDSVDVITIHRNNSYGRKVDGGEEWSFFSEPTPGASNSEGGGYDTSLEAPAFSQEGGFYEEGFPLTLTSEEGATIYYTLDGSEPTEESIKYEGPIEIKREVLTSNHSPQRITANNPPQSPLSFIETASDELYGEWGYQRYKWHPPQGESMKGTVVRAKAFKEGALSSQIATHTYFIAENIQDRFNMPVISISTAKENLFDYHEGIYILGQYFDSWRKKNPDKNVLGNAPANYNQEGKEWERPIYIEFYEADGSLGFSQAAGVRTHGGFTRGWAQKTLRIYARRGYDEESYFNYEIFPGRKKPESNETLQQFKRLILRGSGNDWTYTLFRDGFTQELVKDFQMDTQGYRAAVVYINGEYWGIHNIRQRYDADYLNLNYNVDPNNVSIVEIRELEKAPREDSQHYIQMINFIKENDLSIQKNYEYVKTLMDIENFIDYHITGIYIANTDWLQNNLQFWRLKTDQYEPNAPYGHDGRWRWMLYDTDMGFDFENTGMYTHNTLDWATTDRGKDRNAPEYTFLLRSLLENPEFKAQFINTFAHYMNTTFHPDRVVEKIDEIENHLYEEMTHNIQRWINFGSMKEWQENVAIMRGFGKERPEYMRRYIIEKFNLGGMNNITIDLPPSEKGSILINGKPIDTNNVGRDRIWQGVYFQGIPIEITVVPSKGYEFQGWDGMDEKDSTLRIELTNDMVLRPILN
mgnify:FL=1